jgi:5-methylcytosine-specific restriction protein A
MARDFVFVWQPNDDFPKAYVDGLLARFTAGGPFIEDWRCATGQTQPGDNAYVFGQGAAHRCIFAVGTVAGPLKPRQPNVAYRYLPVQIEMIADPDAGGLIDAAAIRTLGDGALKSIRRSGVSLAEPIGRGLDRLLASRSILEPDADDTVAEVLVSETPEMRQHRRLERNPAAVRAARSWHGCRCQACGFDFEQTYGDLGSDFIEVHHLKPLSSLPRDQATVLNVVTDFAVLCANCHRMIHRLPDPGDLTVLREVVTSQAKHQT